MDCIKKVDIKRPLEKLVILDHFIKWMKQNYNIHIVASVLDDLETDCSILFINNERLEVNELVTCETIFRVAVWGAEYKKEYANPGELNMVHLFEYENMRNLLRGILLKNKKLGEEFFEAVESEIPKEHIFPNNKLNFLHFLLSCVVRKYRLKAIEEKYKHLKIWFEKHACEDIHIKGNDNKGVVNMKDKAAQSCDIMAGGKTNFIQQIIEEDLRTKKHVEVISRFPPEPNGFLHLGHAKSICLNFGLAEKYGGRTHLRFDDTNPVTEDIRYIDSIQEDVKWLGYDWKNHLYFASDYFQQLYEWAVQLIKQGDAYVDDQTIEEIRKTRGTIKQPGTNSPFRNRSVEENLDLFEKMKNGEFKEGEKVLRAKIDMASGNINMRDPILYRILYKTHPNTKDKWVIYPMYDYAHGQSDSIEKITHSICTLEFESHRPLYDWFQEKLKIFKTRQIEFARLNLTYIVMSKRKLLCLVNEKWVNDWDDPRMPTISGMRRRGYSPDAIKDFCNRVGVARRENLIAFELLELCVREDMNKRAIRLNGVLKPLKVTITNFEEQTSSDAGEDFHLLTCPNHPEDKSFGQRTLKFEKEIYIDEEDFMEVPTEDFYRLSPNSTVRLRYAFCITCNEVIKDEHGKVIELKCTYDKNSKGGVATDKTKKVKSTIHWVAASNSMKAEFRMYGKLFTKANPETDEELPVSKPNDPANELATDGYVMELKQQDGMKEEERDSLNEIEEKEQVDSNTGWRKYINKNSLVVHIGLIEKFANTFKVGDPIQFERVGFFTKDKDSTENLPVFNLTVALVDNFALKKKQDELLKKQREKLERERIANERKMKKEQKKLKEQQKALETNK